MRRVTMDLSRFDYVLPPELIAQHPAGKRDDSRLMVVDRTAGSIHHARFCDLPSFLKPEDLVVLNNSRVIRARLFGWKETGARVEVLLLRQLDSTRWMCLLRPGRRCSSGVRLRFVPGAFEGVCGDEAGEGRRVVNFEWQEGGFQDWLERVGHVPLPPYIRRSPSASEVDDRSRYQTVFASEDGSVAAPTAGLHFTPGLLESLRHCFVTLHVGYGTFRPVQVEAVEDHRMDEEWFTVEPPAAALIEAHRAQQGRLVCVGTTTTRVLEHLLLASGEIQAGSGSTRLFIYPGFHFRAAGTLVTNFHLPKSTLLLLVAAFGGWELIASAYRQAIEQRYRFYSYGDAMLIR